MVFNGRKGAENVIAALILFIAVMALATTTTIVFKNYLDKSSNAVNEQQQRSVDVMKTSFTIASAAYDGASTTYIYAKNTGSTRFDPDDIDLYIDGVRIQRNESFRNISVATDTDTTNTGIWDPNEELEIEYYNTFSVSETHTATIILPNGVSAEEEFSS